MYGVALIKNASTDMADSGKLAEKVAFIRKTHYGYKINKHAQSKITTKIILQ